MGEAVGSCGGLLRRRRSLKVLSTTLGRFRGRARARARFRGGDRGVGQPVAMVDRRGGVEVDGGGERGGEGGGRGVGREGGGGGVAVEGVRSAARGEGARRRRAWGARWSGQGGGRVGGARRRRVRGDRMEKWPELASGLDILRPVCRVSARYDTRQRF